MVGDVLKTLGDLAHFWRKQQRGLRVVAITGSNGKTTTKEMTAQILSGAYRVLKTEGNLNNLIGLPLILLGLSPAHEVAVLEMGMNLRGEVRRLKAIAEPQISLITNIGRAHLEFLGSLEGVARAKGELWEGLTAEDWIAVNVDDPRVVELAAAAKCRKKTFGVRKEADVRAEEITLDLDRGVRFSLNLEGKKRTVQLATYGRHNVYNALSAATLGTILGMELEEIVAGLDRFQPYPGRGRIIHLPGPIHVLDDTYNSNPDSLEATLSAFSEMKGKSRGLLVMGDMLEIGKYTIDAHIEVGNQIAKVFSAKGAVPAGRQGSASGGDILVTVGPRSKFIAEAASKKGMSIKNIFSFESADDAKLKIQELIKKGDLVLVKGSHAMELEKVVDEIKVV